MDLQTHTTTVTLALGSVLLFSQTALWEYRIWNRGIGPGGEPWMLVGRESNGRRRYRDFLGNRCLILWPVDHHR